MTKTCIFIHISFRIVKRKCSSVANVFLIWLFSVTPTLDYRTQITPSGILQCSLSRDSLQLPGISKGTTIAAQWVFQEELDKWVQSVGVTAFLQQQNTHHVTVNNRYQIPTTRYSVSTSIIGSIQGSLYRFVYLKCGRKLYNADT